MNDFYALIIAGGSGTRFWPASRKRFPKQFLKIKENSESLIKMTHKRVLNIFDISKIYYVANRDYVELIKKELGDIKQSNFIVEPLPRNTAPAIGLSAAIIYKKDPNAVMAVLPSDHYIEREDLFVDVLRVAYQVSKDGSIITIGITPDRPETGFGYIRKGALIETIGGIDINGVEAFIEKPNRQKAIEYISTGRYLWNAGIFIFKAERILEEIKRLMPETFESIMKTADVIDTDPEKAEVEFSKITSVSIDYGIMEKVQGIRVIPADLKWSDVGSWGAVKDILPKDHYGNVNIGENILVDCQDCLVRSDGRLVALIGLSNMAVIVAEDAILITPIERSQDVKKVVDELDRREKKELI